MLSENLTELQSHHSEHQFSLSRLSFIPSMDIADTCLWHNLQIHPFFYFDFHVPRPDLSFLTPGLQRSLLDSRCLHSSPSAYCFQTSLPKSLLLSACHPPHQEIMIALYCMWHQMKYFVCHNLTPPNLISNY